MTLEVAGRRIKLSQFPREKLWPSKRNLSRNDDSRTDAVTQVRSSQVWDVEVTTSDKNIIKSSILPSKWEHPKKLRVSVDIITPTEYFVSNEDRIQMYDNAEVGNEMMKCLLVGDNRDFSTERNIDLLDRDSLVLRFLGPNSVKKSSKVKPSNSSPGNLYDANNDKDCDRSISTLGLSGVEDEADKRQWFDHLCVSIDSVEVISVLKNVCILKINCKKKRRHLSFHREREALSFYSLIQKLKRLQLERSKKHLVEAMKAINFKTGVVSKSIIRSTIDVVCNDEDILVLRDLNITSPSSLLIIPKEYITRDLQDEFSNALINKHGKILVLAQEIAQDKSLGFGNGVYSVINEWKINGSVCLTIHLTEVVMHSKEGGSI